MMDKRKFNSGLKGNRGGGRKSKDSEHKLIEKLDNLINSDDVVLKLKELIKEGNFNALKLYMSYRFGSPVDKIEMEQITEETFKPVTINFTRRKDEHN